MTRKGINRRAACAFFWTLFVCLFLGTGVVGAEFAPATGEALVLLCGYLALSIFCLLVGHKIRTTKWFPDIDDWNVSYDR